MLETEILSPWICCFKQLQNLLLWPIFELVLLWCKKCCNSSICGKGCAQWVAGTRTPRVVKHNRQPGTSRMCVPASWLWTGGSYKVCLLTLETLPDVGIKCSFEHQKQGNKRTYCTFYSHINVPGGFKFVHEVLKSYAKIILADEFPIVLDISKSSVSLSRGFSCVQNR